MLVCRFSPLCSLLNVLIWLLPGMEKSHSLGDYSFSALSSGRGAEGSLAEQAAQSAAASTFEVHSSRRVLPCVCFPCVAVHNILMGRTTAPKLSVQLCLCWLPCIYLSQNCHPMPSPSTSIAFRAGFCALCYYKRLLRA